jgi:Mg-chelatase subunit ChlD
MRVALALVMVAVFSSIAYGDGALVVAIDRSIEPDKMTAVTHALVSSLDTFDEHAEIAIVSYGTSARVEVGLVSVKNRNRVSGAVTRIQPADRADTAAGLRVAGDLLARSKRRHKRILLVTESGTGAYEPVMSKLRKQGIVISALGFQLMNRAGIETLASAGGGHAYPVRRSADLGASIKAAASMKQPPPLTLAVVLVIDRSGSMSGAKIEAAKEAARATVEGLGPDDTIAVIAFDSESEVFVQPQRAVNKMKISAEVSRLESGGGTNIYPGLKEAYEMLGAISATQKHVILLSDGEAPSDGIDLLVQDMRAADITVSSVGLQGADRNLLNMIAENGNGRLYMVEDLGALPKIFLKETLR